MYIPKRLTKGIIKILRSPLFEVVDFAKFREIADEVRNSLGNRLTLSRCLGGLKRLGINGRNIGPEVQVVVSK